jgi:hypothetical protein
MVMVVNSVRERREVQSVLLLLLQREGEGENEEIAEVLLQLIYMCLNRPV